LRELTHVAGLGIDRPSMIPLKAMGVAVSTVYRVYVLDREGHVSGPPIDITCKTDEEAMTAAREQLRGYPVEVWLGARRVGRLDPDRG
jgi:hypothetical protein